MMENLMAGKRIVIPNYMPALDLNGNPQAGAKLTFYDNETTDLAPIYTSAGLTVQHPNPITADASGVFPSIFADENDVFSVAITDANDVPIGGLRNTDNIRPSVVFLDGATAPVSDAVAAVLAEETLEDARAAFGLGGAILEDVNAYSVFDAANPANYGYRIDSVASGKQVDGIYIYSEFVSTGSGYPFHGVAYSDATVGADAAGGVGGAIGGPGLGSGVVGNRQEAGDGNGVQGARLGSGIGAGVEARASSTGTCYAVRGIKQNPVAGTAGDGPAIFAINDSTNGEAIYGRSASANTTENTAVFDRLNGTAGTVLFARVTGVGPRTGLVRGAASHVVPTAASTGTGLVIGHDVQVNGNITGSANAKGINVANAATGGAEAYGMQILVDGVSTDAYGLFVNVANSTNNFGVYVANGLSYFGGNVNSAAEYRVAGTKVVGAQGAAVADATDAASAITQLNALLARCRAHGLIAT